MARVRREFTVRSAVVGDVPFMWDMLWEAESAAPGVRSLGRDAALALPEVAKYLEGWGREGDAAVVAVERGGRQLGAAWYRLFPSSLRGYGWVDAGVPEITLAVASDARREGIGAELLEEILETARAQRYEAVSLSVNRRNPALLLYERYGFVDAGVSRPEDAGVTMIARLSPR